VLILDMIEVLPPLKKYKYDTCRILPMKCYIDNSVRLRSYIRNVNNPDKIHAIVHMKPLGSKKAVQRLTCRIAALNWFMAKIAEQSLPFFKVLRGSDTFEWGLEQQEAFEALKEYIQELPTLASPQPDYPLILYVSATHTAFSGALVEER
jgi:hypothetical protein